MNIKGVRLIAAVWVALLLAAGVAAQQQPTDLSARLESMRAAFERLRAVDRDPNTLADIRAFNREVLAEKEAQLRLLLEAKRDQWRGYLSDRARELSEEQVRRVGKIIDDLDAELRQLAAPAEAVGERAASTAAPDSERPFTARSASASPSVQPGVGDASDVRAAASPGAQDPPASDVQDPPAPGPSTPPALRPLTLDDQLSITANGINSQRQADPSSGLAGFDFRRDINLIALTLLTQKAKAEAVTDAENSRTDKQIGGSESQSGTTSLVSKGGIPAVLGFAVENGALTRTADGTTITFRVNPVGLVDMLAQRGFITSFQTETPFERFLRNFALGFSFDASRGDTGGVFTGGRQQLSGLSVRYNIVNRRDPRHRRFTDDFVNLARNQGVPIAADYARLIRLTFLSPDLPQSVVDWERKTDEALRLAPPDRVRGVLLEQLNKFPLSDLPPEVDATINSLARNLAGFRQTRDALLKRVSSGLVMTAEYNLERRGDLPDLSNFRFIAEKGPYDGKLDLTFNASMSLYHSRPAGVGANRLRDFRFAGQLDVPFGDVARTGKFLLSFAGRYERLMEDETLPAGGIVATKGDLAVGQLKLTVPIRGTAFKIPLSLSFANRTELLDEKEVRGNFGFTFDLDSIFAKFNPFKP
jgi:hypothetical protein